MSQQGPGWSYLERGVNFLRGDQCSRRTRRWIYSFAVLFFFVFFGFSLRAYPVTFQVDHLLPVSLILFVCIPLTLLLNAWEYRLIAQTVGVTPSLGRALQVSVVASTTNLLPVPGAVMTRMTHLYMETQTLARPFRAILLFYGYWLSTALVFCGGFLVWLRMPEAWLLLSSGGILFAGLFAGSPKMGVSYPMACQGVAQRVLLLVVESLRYYFAFQVLDATVTLIESSLFSLSSALSAAVGFLPAGLGIREAVSAVIADYLNRPLALGFLAAALNRVFSILFLVSASLVVAHVVSSRTSAPDPQTSTGEGA